MSTDQHFQLFSGLVGRLLEEDRRYLNHPASDPLHDGIGFRQVPLWMSNIEFEEFVQGFRALIANASQFPPQ